MFPVTNAARYCRPWWSGAVRSGLHGGNMEVTLATV